MEHRIPAENLGRLRYDLARLNKRALRLGLAPIVLSELRVDRVVNNDALGMQRERVFHIVEVTGTTPVLDGWTFIAALKHIEGQVLIKVASGATLPERYLTASPEECDHCHTRRARLAAFVVQHTDGRTAIVGRNCLADYIRTTSPEMLASQAEFLTSLDFGGYEAEEESDAPRGRQQHQRINAEDYMVAVLRDIAARGKYVSRKNADPKTNPATSDSALEINISDATETERDLARAVIDWASAWGADADPSREDYRYNVGQVASMEYLEDRTWALFASIPSAKARADEKAEARAAENKRPSEFIGTVGKREVFTLTVSRPTTTRDGDWGTTYLYFFVDELGNDVRYFASRPLEVDRGSELETLSSENEVMNGENTRPLRVGDKVSIKATVKKHDIWNDRKQTTITRGVVQTLLGSAVAAAA